MFIEQYNIIVKPHTSYFQQISLNICSWNHTAVVPWRHVSKKMTSQCKWNSARKRAYSNCPRCRWTFEAFWEIFFLDMCDLLDMHCHGICINYSVHISSIVLTFCRHIFLFIFIYFRKQDNKPEINFAFKRSI